MSSLLRSTSSGASQRYAEVPDSPEDEVRRRGRTIKAPIARKTAIAPAIETTFQADPVAEAGVGEMAARSRMRLRSPGGGSGRQNFSIIKHPSISLGHIGIGWPPFRARWIEWKR